MNKDKLWGYRFSFYVKEILKYLRYILTGHFVIVLVFLAGWGAFEYQKWLKVVDSDFPVGIVVALTLGILLSWSPVQTFLKNADVVFLTPMESNMKSYIAKSFMISFMWQSIIVFTVYLGFVPLLTRLNSNSFHFWLVLIVILILKFLNLVSQFFGNFGNATTKFWERYLLIAFRIVFSFLVILPLLEKEIRPYLSILLLVVWIVNLLFNIKISVKGKPLPWLKLIDNDTRSMNGFYRFANLFTDVPQLQNRVIERKWLNFVLNNKWFSTKKTMDYLFIRTFIRSNDYFGLFARLTTITIVILISTNPGMGAIFIGILSLYLVGFQLLPFAKHHDFQMWLDIYPISKEQTKIAAIVLLRKMLLIQNGLLSIAIIFVVEFRIGLMSLFTGIAFILVFLEYAKRKI
ncbi:MAG: transporter permease [Bacillales bacterium]|jgi:ABC-2 type transport system permease protein|nr:transporter permease [Bacillales bacterium]